MALSSVQWIQQFSDPNGEFYLAVTPHSPAGLQLWSTKDAIGISRVASREESTAANDDNEADDDERENDEDDGIEALELDASGSKGGEVNEQIVAPRTFDMSRLTLLEESNEKFAFFQLTLPSHMLFSCARSAELIDERKRFGKIALPVLMDGKTFGVFRIRVDADQKPEQTDDDMEVVQRMVLVLQEGFRTSRVYSRRVRVLEEGSGSRVELNGRRCRRGDRNALPQAILQKHLSMRSEN